MMAPSAVRRSGDGVLGALDETAAGGGAEHPTSTADTPTTAHAANLFIAPKLLAAFPPDAGSAGGRILTRDIAQGLEEVAALLCRNTR